MSWPVVQELQKSKTGRLRIWNSEKKIWRWTHGEDTKHVDFISHVNAHERVSITEEVLNNEVDRMTMVLMKMFIH